MEATAVKVFEFNGAQVRIVDSNGELCWIAKDVCDVLDLANVSQALAGLDDDEKGITTADTPGGAQTVATVSEPGLYSLILRSRKPEAKAFKRWIVHEVLPAIRQGGAYVAPGAMVGGRKLPGDYVEALEALIAAERERQALTAKVAAQLPLVEFANAVADAPELVTTSVIAKQLGTGPVLLHKWLHSQNVIYRQGGVWLPYHKYQAEGLCRIVTHHFTKGDGSDGAKETLKWTRAGQAWIIRRWQSRHAVTPAAPELALASGVQS